MNENNLIYEYPVSNLLNLTALQQCSVLNGCFPLSEPVPLDRCRDCISLSRSWGFQRIVGFLKNIVKRVFRSGCS